MLSVVPSLCFTLSRTMSLWCLQSPAFLIVSKSDLALLLIYIKNISCLLRGMAQGTQAHGRLPALEYRHRFLERSQKARQVLRHEDTEVTEGSELQKVRFGFSQPKAAPLSSSALDRREN